MFRFAIRHRECGEPPRLSEHGIAEDGEYARERVAKCLLKHAGHDSYCSFQSWTCTDSECLEIMDEICYRWETRSPSSVAEAISDVMEVFGCMPVRVWLEDTEHRVGYTPPPRQQRASLAA